MSSAMDSAAAAANAGPKPASIPPPARVVRRKPYRYAPLSLFLFLLVLPVPLP